MEYTGEAVARRAAEHARAARQPEPPHAIVTGATGPEAGQVGFRAARALAMAGMRVTLAYREQAPEEESLTAALKARAAIENAASGPGKPAFVAIEPLDLRSDRAINTFVARATGYFERPVHRLVHCATAAPYVAYTNDLRDAHFAVQRGWWVLLELLMQRLLTTPNSRIVTLIYPTYKFGDFDKKNLAGTIRARRTAMFAERQAEMVKAVLAHELGQRLIHHRRPWPVSVVALPRDDDVMTHRMIKRGHRTGVVRADEAAAPVIQAATVPGARHGDAYSLSDMGTHIQRPLHPYARDRDVAAWLWEEMRELTHNGDPIMRAIAPTEKVPPASYFATDMHGVDTNWTRVYDPFAEALGPEGFADLLASTPDGT